MRIKDHAVTRYRERTGCKATDDWIRSQLLRLLETAEEVVLRRRFRALQLMKHGFTPARYYQVPAWGHPIKARGLILVVEQDCLLRTVHRGESRKWRPKGAS